jgi:AcrR family transcriptional regulator
VDAETPAPTDDPAVAAGARTAPRRQRREDVETRLIEKASELIVASGLSLTLDRLRIDELLDETGIPRTTFYRRWRSKDELLAQILVAVLENSVSAESEYDEAASTTVAMTVAAHHALMSTRAGRYRVLREAIRMAVHENFIAVRSSVQWKMLVAIRATIDDMPDDDSRRRITQALTITEEHFIKKMAELYTRMLPVFNYRFRPGTSAQQLAISGAALVEGLAARSTSSADVVDLPIPGPGVDGDPVPWHLASLAFWAMLQAFAEQDETP